MLAARWLTRQPLLRTIKKIREIRDQIREIREDLARIPVHCEPEFALDF